MVSKQNLTKTQKAQIDAEQKKYNEAVARAKKAGKEFDPLDDAPTPAPGNDPVQIAISKIWFGKMKQ